jgi:hypothetical protein
MKDIKRSLITKTKEVVVFIQDGNGNPYYYADNWKGAADEMSDQNIQDNLQSKNFPFVFLHDDFEEEVNTETLWSKPSTFYLYIVDDVEDIDLNVLNQDKGPFINLRQIETDLLNSFKSKGCKFTNYNSKDYFYHSDESNRINRNAYVIRMRFTDFQYQIKCKIL